MVGLRESWCFCKGVSKSERTMAAIFSGKAPAMARVSATAGGNGISGAGFLIHRNLLLTTHVNLPSVSAAETAEIRLQNGVAATLAPHRFDSFGPFFFFSIDRYFRICVWLSRYMRLEEIYLLSLLYFGLHRSTKYSSQNVCHLIFQLRVKT